MATTENTAEINPPIKPGDKFQVGSELASGEIMWGTIQTATSLTSDGVPYYRPKWAKADKLPDFWRLPPDGESETASA